MATADKASNFVIIVLRIHYIYQELNRTNAYALTSSSESIIDSVHSLRITKSRISVEPKQDNISLNVFTQNHIEQDLSPNQVRAQLLNIQCF